MKQSQDTPKDTSPNLELIQEVGDKAMERLMKEFDLKLKEPKGKAKTKPKAK